MKKIISIIMACLVTGALFVGCGKYEPKLADTGVQYVTKTNQMPDGQYPGIIIESVKKDGDTIVVKTQSPIEQMQYALKNFICFQVINKKGDKDAELKVKLKESDEQGIFILTPTQTKMDDIKYLEVGPYKDGDDYIEFEVK